MSDALGHYVHRFEPARAAAPARTLLLLHGTGGDERDLLPLAERLDPDAAVLSLRGNVPEHGMPRFFRRLAEGVFDEADLVRRTHELAEFLAAAERAYAFTPSRLVAVGYSNGANIAASLLLLRPGTLAGAVLFRAMVPIEPDTPPRLDGVPVWMGEGREDHLIPPENAARLEAMLRGAGADVTLHWSPAGHGLTPGDVDAARAWLAGAGERI
jgi:phospholipase/carboxylesterase/glyoxalase family protein